MKAITERLTEIRSKPFGDLAAAEQADWMTHDPDGYFAAANAWAREVVEQEAGRAVQRRRARDRERMLRPFRRLRRLLTGRSRRDTEEAG